MMNMLSYSTPFWLALFTVATVRADCGDQGDPPCFFTGCDSGYDKITAPRGSYSLQTIFYSFGGRTACIAEPNDGGCGTARSICTKQVNTEKKQRLAAQNHLDYTAPFNQVTWMGTHNSYAATDDGFNAWANQKKGLKNQLRAGYRVLNLDVHNVGSDNPNRPTVCHDSTATEANCFSVSGGHREDFSWALEEIAEWIDDEGQGEVIFLVLEDYFNDGTHGDEHVARREAARDIRNKLGSRVYSPELYWSSSFPSTSSGRCTKAKLPISGSGAVTKAKVVAAGASVLVATTEELSCCDCPNSLDWRALVWELPNDSDDSYGGGGGLPSPESRDEARLHFIFEDRAWNKEGMLFNMGDLKPLVEKAPHMVGLDYGVIYDRYKDFLWSWRENEPVSGTTKNCARLRDENDGKYFWEAETCVYPNNALGYNRLACWKDTAGTKFGEWRVTQGTFRYAAAKQHDRCGEQLGTGWKFRMPYNAAQNKALKNAATAANARQLWIPYERQHDGQWRDACGPDGNCMTEGSVARNNVCNVDSDCSDSYCNHLIDPPRCSNRAPGGFLSTCNQDSDCPSDSLCQLWGGSYGSCRKKAGYSCSYGYYCLANCGSNNDCGYLGCFRDQRNPRDLGHLAISASGSLTVLACTEKCKDQGYSFAGVQNGNECWCGNNYNSHGTATNCDHSCTGSNDICGGDWANSVYDVRG